MEPYEFKLEMHRDDLERLVTALRHVDSGEKIEPEDYEVLKEALTELAPLVEDV